MRTLFKVLALSMAAATALAGSIEFAMPPIISGEVVAFEDQHQTSERELTPTQLQAVAKWLTWNQQGWFATEAKSPSQPVEFQLNLRHSDGTTAAVSVVAEAGGTRHQLYFINNGAPSSYYAWFGRFKSRAATRPLAGYELEALKRAVNR
jgi:hypothetical protein